MTPVAWKLAVGLTEPARMTSQDWRDVAEKEPDLWRLMLDLGPTEAVRRWRMQQKAPGT